jgi:hypothetical protein
MRPVTSFPIRTRASCDVAATRQARQGPCKPGGSWSDPISMMTRCGLGVSLALLLVPTGAVAHCTREEGCEPREARERQLRTAMSAKVTELSINATVACDAIEDPQGRWECSNVVEGALVVAGAALQGGSNLALDAAVAYCAAAELFYGVQAVWDRFWADHEAFATSLYNGWWTEFGLPILLEFTFMLLEAW